MSEGLSYFLELFLAAAIPAGMPLLYGTLGEILTEKGGNLNLGVEGAHVHGARFLASWADIMPIACSSCCCWRLRAARWAR